MQEIFAAKKHCLLTIANTKEWLEQDRTGLAALMTNWR